MMSAFFQFQHTLNRLFNNYIKLYDKFFLKYEGGSKLTPLLPLKKKLPSKSPDLLRLKDLDVAKVSEIDQISVTFLKDGLQ